MKKTIKLLTVATILGASVVMTACGSSEKKEETTAELMAPTAQDTAAPAAAAPVADTASLGASSSGLGH